MRTYGKLTYCDTKGQRLWHLEAEPHVIIRAKRIFQGATKTERGELVLKDSQEICRELEWFADRYPLEMQEVDYLHLTASAEQHKERMTLLEEMLAGRLEPRAFEMALEPRAYQRLGAEMLLRVGGLLLADDVGLGKTCTAICALTDPRTRPALVVTLTHLPWQWRRELVRFAPQLKVHVIARGAPYEPGSTKAAELAGSDVVILSYSKLAGWANTLAPLVRSVVYDEIQELRNGTKTDKGIGAAIISANVDFKLGLSATPIYNYGAEIHEVLQFVAPDDALGDRAEFLREWCGETDSRGRSSIADPKAFGQYLREQGLMLRRTRADVGRELPDLLRISHEIECDEEPLKNITSAAEKLAAIILAHRESERGDKMRASEELSSLVRHATGVAKAPYVAEFVRMLLENGEKVVLYAWHRDVYAILNERLGEYGPVMYTGTESAKQKEAAKKAFVEGDCPLLMMSLRAGAGLDGLQHVCRTVVFAELDWSPGVHEQCIGRVYRDGAGEGTVVYYLLAAEGSDPIVADVLGVKRVQVEGIRNPDQDLIEKLDTSGERVKALAEHYLAKPRTREGGEVRSFTEAKTRQPETT